MSEPMIDGQGEMSLDQVKTVTDGWAILSDSRPLVADRLWKEIEALRSAGPKEENLLELRASQNKIRKQKKELRLIGAAHQRLLFLMEDLRKQKNSAEENCKRWQTHYYKKIGHGPGPLRLAVRDIALWLQRWAA